MIFHEQAAQKPNASKLAGFSLSYAKVMSLSSGSSIGVDVPSSIWSCSFVSS